MENATPLALKPRKQPRQARASLTVDTIFEAAIQVLLAGGLGRLTTTRVAERAGVSVGTIYQYFPNKQAMLYAFLERHITTIGDTVVDVCNAQHGVPLARMAEALVEGYLRAKKPQHHISQILYAVAEELRAESLIASQLRRVEDAVMQMLSTATDRRPADLRIVTEILLSAVTGVVRTQFERDPSKIAEEPFQQHLSLMCRAYLEAACGR